jgi:hypothetical protein
MQHTPTLAILLWIKISGIKSGYLFPSWHDILVQNQNPTKPLCYKAYLSFIKFVIKGNDQHPAILTKKMFFIFLFYFGKALFIFILFW